MTDRTMDRWRRRGGVAFVAATVAASGLMLVPAAEAALPPAQSTAEVCAEVEAGSSGFTDISDNTHEVSIECVAAADIARGTSPTTFNPGGIVSRGQMASFIARTIDVANELELVDIPALPSSPADKFGDDNGNTHEANINRLAAASIVNGKSATAFDPDAPVSRAQMATFIANTQSFLSDGTAPFGSWEDFFTDDQTNVHQANINAIAAAGVAQGVDGVRYQPNAPVLRSQMTTFLARYLGVLEANDVIAPIDGEGTVKPPAPPTNATLKFTPVEAARVVAAEEPSDTDDRTYTATGLDAAKQYRVTLFNRENVSVTAGPVFVFEEQGDSGFAAPGSVGARITRVNGTAVTASDSVGGIAPSGGQITVVVDGASFSQLLPVIHEDQGGGETALNLDDKNQPSEAFGVGGLLEVLPAEGGTELPDGSKVLLADKGAKLIVVGLPEGPNFSYRYDANDEFYIGAPIPADEVTLAKFEQDLSQGDTLVVDTYVKGDPNSVSKFVLTNVVTDAPSAVLDAERLGSRSAVIRVTELKLGAQANVHIGDDEATFAQSPLKVSALEDALPDVPGFQVVVSGLTPDKSYEFYVTQTIDGETSAPHAEAPGASTELNTLSATPELVSAAFDPARPSNKVALTFDRLVAPTEGAKAGIKVVCKTPDVIPIILPGTTTTFTVTSIAETIAKVHTVTLNAQVPTNAGTCGVQLAKDVVIDTAQIGNAAVNKGL